MNIQEKKRLQNIENVKKFQQKKQAIKQAIKKDYSNLIFEIEQYGEKKKILIGEKVPLMSFSTLVRGINMGRFENIPPEKLKGVSDIGKKVMENLETFFYSGEFIHDNEKVKKINLIINEWLKFKGYEIKAVEKLFISPCNKYYGYIDLIAFDTLKKQYILVEIKTRGKNYRGIDNITKAQAQFYKENFYNIKTIVLTINRDFDYTKKLELKSNWKYEETFINNCKNFVRIIKLYNDVENWSNYNNISLQKK